MLNPEELKAFFVWLLFGESYVEAREYIPIHKAEPVKRQ